MRVSDGDGLDMKKFNDDDDDYYDAFLLCFFY